MLRQMHKEMLQLKITHFAFGYGKIWETSTSDREIQGGCRGVSESDMGDPRKNWVCFGVNRE